MWLSGYWDSFYVNLSSSKASISFFSYTIYSSILSMQLFSSLESLVGSRSFSHGFSSLNLTKLIFSYSIAISLYNSLVDLFSSLNFFTSLKRNYSVNQINFTLWRIFFSFLLVFQHRHVALAFLTLWIIWPFLHHIDLQIVICILRFDHEFFWILSFRVPSGCKRLQDHRWVYFFLCI